MTRERLYPRLISRLGSGLWRAASGPEPGSGDALMIPAIRPRATRSRTVPAAARSGPSPPRSTTHEVASSTPAGISRPCRIVQMVVDGCPWEMSSASSLQRNQDFNVITRKRLLPRSSPRAPRWYRAPVAEAAATLCTIITDEGWCVTGPGSCGAWTVLARRARAPDMRPVQ